MTGTRLAVDYGTSNTVAMLAFADGRARPLLFDGSPLLPSAVYAQPDGLVLTGRDAQNSARLDPSRYEPNPKRRIDDRELLLGDRSWPLADLIARTLAHVAAEAARTAGGPVGSLVMTCPVAWGPMRRRTLQDAAQRARLPRPTLVTEPVAAASYFAAKLDRQVTGGRSVVVYDLGGGTFDVCVVRREAGGFQPLAYRGMDDFGGVDLDALVIAQVGASVRDADPQAWRRLTVPETTADKRCLQAFWDHARGAKESLSRRSHVQILVPITDKDTTVSREAFEHDARATLQRTVDTTRAVMREAHVEAGDVAGVFLVGGSTRVPMVATLLHQGLGIAPTIIEQPETVVAEGALVATAAPAARPAPLARPVPAGPTLRPQVGTRDTATEPPPPASALLGVVLIGVGLLMLLGAPWTAINTGDDYPMSLVASVGAFLLLGGNVTTWFWARLPRTTRFALPGAYLALSPYWFLIEGVDSSLEHAEVGFGGWVLLGFCAATALLTAATYRLGKR
ncbi:Hsp70 family protein [Phytomonospora sp. NPDC050363]|uniref:Hsp70 family protein n=1 Tax=Phytomonospora sp. NPDC050363 TaxID=3155642 RepID=UPI0033FBD4A2